MKKYKIAICSCARLKSSRCKKKMIKKFNNTSLTDLMLQKLKKKFKITQNLMYFLLVTKKYFQKSQKNIIYLLFKERKNQQILMDQLLKFIIFKNLDYDYFFFNQCLYAVLKSFNNNEIN